MTEIDKMNDLEYQEYCLKEYAEFFKQLEKENLYNKNNTLQRIRPAKNTYYFEGKTLVVRKNQILIVSKENKYSHDMSTNKIIIEKAKIPGNLKVLDTSLEIIDYPEEVLSDNLYVDHSLIISEGNKIIKYFGKNTIVGGNLKAVMTSLESLDNFNFIALELGRYKTTKEMLEGTRNYYHIRNPYIQILGNNGTIDITSSNVKKLPDGLRVRGDLYISDTPIEYIGKNTIIGGHIFLYKSILKEFPNDIQLSDESCIEITYIKNKNIKLLESFKDKRYILCINTFIKNIDELYKDESELKICFGNSYSKYIINDSKSSKYKIIFEKQIFEEENEFMSYFHDLNISTKDEKIFQIYIKNLLLYYNAIPIRKKLLLEDFKNITQEEIDLHINNINIPYEKKLTEKRIQFGALINFCRTHKAMEFIYKNGYNFNKLEYNSLLDKEIKNLYLKFLLKKEIKIDLNDNLNNIKKKKRHRENII